MFHAKCKKTKVPVAFWHWNLEKWDLGSASGPVYSLGESFRRKCYIARRWKMKRESSEDIQMSVWLSLQAKSLCLPRSHEIVQDPWNHFLFLLDIFIFLLLATKTSFINTKEWVYLTSLFCCCLNPKSNPSMTQKLLGSVLKFSSLNTIYWW